MQHPSRRQFLHAAAALAAAATAGVRVARAVQDASAAGSADPATGTAPATTSTTTTTTTPATNPALIDRPALIARHAVKLTAFDPANALHVGNGDFAFGVDVTGLQTFREQHAGRFPLLTLANWAWHRASVSASQPTVAPSRDYDVGGRMVSYADASAADPTARADAQENPHRVPLPHVAFVDALGNALLPEAIANVRQTLDLWAGTITSRFDYRGKPVEVITVAHPSRSLVSVRISAPSLPDDTIGVRVGFVDDGTSGIAEPEQHGWLVPRKLDDVTFVTRVRSESAGDHTMSTLGSNAFVYRVRREPFALTLEFLPGEAPIDGNGLPAFDEVTAAAAANWRAFWTDGAAIDFSGCTDARAPELEHRVILSQYLTAVHCGGSMPSPTTGLAFDRPAGKATLDAHWWQAAHFAMWGRPAPIERSLAFYQRILSAAREAAQRQGYQGARWPRLCGPDGVETPDEVGPFLIWQQPHAIYFAEAAYRAKPTKESLDRYAELVEETAHFLANYARPDSSGRYVLGPALVPAQESYAADRAHVINPTFELAYWAWALGIAQKWRDRLGLPRQETWDRVQQKLSKPTIRDGRYAAIEIEPYLVNGDHPSFLFALGLVPKTHLIDDDVMRETARWTRAKWKWNDAWGVDFAGLAQTATRLGDAELAVDALLIESERNRYSTAGHNHPSDDRPVDLSANGALLAAIALMAGGWEGMARATGDTPGFPKNGKWNVRAEGFGKVI